MSVISIVVTVIILHYLGCYIREVFNIFREEYRENSGYYD